jgi:ABC-type multidrug transport system ATPase subunit
MEPVLTTSASIPAVALSRVSRLFGNFAALREVTLTVPAGATIMLLGENGAGKSTLLRLIAGLGSPSFGELAVFGEEPVDVRERIAYMSHATMLYDELTAMENLAYVTELYETNASPAEALVAVGLDPANPRRVGEYSQGMRQRTALARALITSPDLLLLDEPFSNLDVASVDRMIVRLQVFLAEPGSDGGARTLILTTHQRELARPLAPTTVTLHGGRLLEAEVAR